MNRVQPGHGFAVRYAGVAVFLLVTLAATIAIREWRTNRAEDHAVELREKRVRDALDHIQQDFTRRQQDLLETARHVARDGDVIAALRSLARGQRSMSDVAASLAPRIAPYGDVEIYDVMPRLVAWNGHSMPLDDAPSRLQFLEASQVSVVSDEDWQSAVVAWWPVFDGRRPIGAVRTIELVAVRVPVENEFLRDRSLARDWRFATGRPVDVVFGTTPVRSGQLRSNQRVLQGVDGTPLGVVTVQPPTGSEILREIGTRYDDVAAFWATLLLFWLLAGLYYLYRRSHGRFDVLTSFAAFVIALWASRGALLAMDVPARWQVGKAPLAPLFDPMRLASTAGFGTLSSAGDVFVTAVFAVVFAIVVLHLLHGHVQTNRSRSGIVWRRPGVAGLAVAAALVSSIALACIALMSAIVHRVVLDSTLDYYARSGIIPTQAEWLVSVVFAALLLFMLAFVVTGTGLFGWWIRVVASYRDRRVPPQFAAAIVAIALIVPVMVAYLAFDFQERVPWPTAVGFLVVVSVCGFMFFLRRGEGYRLLTLRGVLMGVFILAVLLYPTYYNSIDTKRRIQMMDAAETFDEGRDPRILFGLEQVLDQMSGHDRMASLLQRGPASESRAEIDSIASHYLRSSLLGSLGPYDVSVTVLSSDGRVAGRNLASDPLFGRMAVDQVDSTEFEVLRAMYEAANRSGPLIDRITGRIELDRMQYVGIVAIAREADTLGWVMARVEPQTLFQYAETPYPRVLLPQGFFDLIHSNVSLAEFQNGVLARSLGRNFGRYRLGEQVQSQMAAHDALWTHEEVEERNYLTYYSRKQPDLTEEAPGPVLRAGMPGVVAVRVAATNTFDHLYYLLRLTVAGLFLGIPLHLIGVYLRWQAGVLPAERVPFREKVLNAFLFVGIISVAAVGFVGGQVVEEGTEASVRSSLRQHLERVEQTLVLEAKGGELPYRTLDRVGLDSLAARSGLDLNLYRDWQLVESSRPQLMRDRLLDDRLPIDAFSALYHDGHRFTATTEHIGTFEYKAGFRTLLDEQGTPRYVVSVPILPEQERIEEEQARTIAYLFGALLILVLVVMFTASILADALARPVARLRAGLEAVARGRFERSIPVQSRDEIGELVETFNLMQEQLAESRRKLAQQERQLAWREMARQVAHEIKNPLTPMKLSVQHLRRAFENLDGEGQEAAPKSGKFASMFDRVTVTLIEQINTLARIADEFSSFAKLPTRVHEELDLNAVIEQAVSLMQEEQAAEVLLELSEEAIIVMADREELRRVYINLIKNAIQSVPEDRPGRVVVSSRAEESASGRKWAWSTVTDNGSGIPEEVREKIFEPNFSTKTSGMGLGLAIVRKSIEAMQGEIGFDTSEGEGTTFWIRLPLAEEESESPSP